MKIYTVLERGETSIPIKDIISRDGIPHVFPEIKSRGFFDLDYRRESLVLVAGKYIGLIPINEWVAIDVKPKVGITSLVHVISKSGEYLDSLDFFERYYKETASLSPTIFDFLANCLASELLKIQKEGLYKQYLQKNEILSGPRGKINIGRTITTQWSRGVFYKVSCDYFNFTADNHFNQMIKFTLWYSLNHLVRSGSNNFDLIKKLSYYYNYFENVSLDIRKSFLDPVFSKINAGKIPTLRNYYINICKICRCLIQDIGVMLSDPGEDVKMLSFIINMENVFEKYLLNVLREFKLAIGSDIEILDGNKEGRGFLFRNNKKVEAKPDIVIKDGTEKVLIIDAKYKTKTAESDRYQLISHALSFGAKKAILILPLTRQMAGLNYLGKVGFDQSIDLYEYYYNLENLDIAVEEKKYVRTVRELFFAV